MKTLLHLLFWLSLLIPVYNYVGYAVLVVIFNKLFGKYPSSIFKLPGAYTYPEVTLLVAAYNEQDFIVDKIENCKQLNYPDSLLTIAFVTDGSTDNTPDIIKRYEGIKLFHHPERKGKAMAINRAMQKIETPVVVFCDANTALNPDSIKEISKHFADAKTGAVAGEKRINPKFNNQAAGAGEGLYWKYESFLKQIDSDFYSVAGAAGELFAVRKELYEPVEADTILDDFMISLRINQKGYRVIYEPGAYALENPSANITEEKKRKIRIAAGGFQSMFRLLPLLNIFKYGRLSFLYISHRVLRWMATPFALPVLFITNALICIYYPSSLYWLIFSAQLLFYSLAVGGWFATSKQLHIPMVKPLYYFVFMNINVYAGLSRYLGGKQSARWQKSERATADSISV